MEPVLLKGGVKDNGLRPVAHVQTDIMILPDDDAKAINKVI